MSTLLAEVQESTGRVSDLIGVIRSYSQLDRASLQWTDVAEGLESTLVMLAGRLPAGVTVVRDYGADVPRIEAYAGELNQVWTHLIDNALDAMGGTGTLRVSTRAADGAGVLVEVADTGPGMSEEVRAHAFEPFYTTKEVGQGTGLGLDVSWRIVVERHGGEIGIESAPGRTVLRVTPAAPRGQLLTARRDPAQGNGRSVQLPGRSGVSTIRSPRTTRSSVARSAPRPAHQHVHAVQAEDVQLDEALELGVPDGPAEQGAVRAHPLVRPQCVLSGHSNGERRADRRVGGRDAARVEGDGGVQPRRVGQPGTPARGAVPVVGTAAGGGGPETGRHPAQAEREGEPLWLDRLDRLEHPPQHPGVAEPATATQMSRLRRSRTTGPTGGGTSFAGRPEIRVSHMRTISSPGRLRLSYWRSANPGSVWIMPSADQPGGSQPTENGTASGPKRMVGVAGREEVGVAVGAAGDTGAGAPPPAPGEQDGRHRHRSPPWPPPRRPLRPYDAGGGPARRRGSGRRPARRPGRALGRAEGLAQVGLGRHRVLLRSRPGSAASTRRVARARDA